MTTKDGQLRIWHIPNFPAKPFRVEVSSVQEAVEKLALLAEYDLYLGELIAYNVSGCQIFEGGEWCEFYDEQDRDIREIAAVLEGGAE